MPNLSRSRSSLLFCLSALSISLFTVSSPSSAQSAYGSVVGTITDVSGAVIGDAAVTLTNLGTAEHRTAQTDANGNYQFVNLNPGTYKVDIAKSGFKHFTRGSIQVEVQSTARIDTSLQVGDVNQTVEVTSQSPLLQTENASVGQVVEGAECY